MKKKVLAIILCVCIIAAFASGCGKDETSTASSLSAAQSSETSSSSSLETLEPVTLDWYMAMWTTYPDEEKVMAEVSKKIEEKLNAKVNIHVSTDAEYKTKMSTMLNAGQQMDMLYLSSTTVPFVDYAKRGSFLAIEDLWEKYAPYLYSNTPKGAIQGVTVDGHIYGIVPFKDLADSISLIYDSRLTQKYNISVPKANEWTTIYDLKDFIYSMHEAVGKEYPELVGKPSMGGANYQFKFFSPYETLSDFAGITIPGFESAFSGKGSGDKVFNVYDTPEYLEFCKTMRKFATDGVYPEDPVNFNKDKAIDLKYPWTFAQGEVVPNKSINPNWEISESKYKVMTTGYVRSMLNVISSNSKNPERALMVLDLVNKDPEIGTMLRFGIENEHWKKSGDKTVTFAGTKNEDTTKRAFYNWYGAQWGGMLNILIPDTVDSTLIEKIKALTNDSNQKTAIGFVFNNTSVQNEIASCKNVIAEYHDLLKLGRLDNVEKNVQEFLAKLKANGSERIVDEVQKQLDAWRASKK